MSFTGIILWIGAFFIFCSLACRLLRPAGAVTPGIRPWYKYHAGPQFGSSVLVCVRRGETVVIVEFVLSVLWSAWSLHPKVNCWRPVWVRLLSFRLWLAVVKLVTPYPVKPLPYLADTLPSSATPFLSPAQHPLVDPPHTDSAFSTQIFSTKGRTLLLWPFGHRILHYPHFTLKKKKIRPGVPN